MHQILLSGYYYQCVIFREELQGRLGGGEVSQEGPQDPAGLVTVRPLDVIPWIRAQSMDKSTVHRPLDVIPQIRAQSIDP